MNFASFLQDQGFRLTKPRREILKVLQNHPQSVQELYDALKENNISIDLVSVYRTLELFTMLGIVSPIDLGEGKKRYELIDGNSHHHHLVCNNCGIIKDVEIPAEKKLLISIKHVSQFEIQQHSLEFFGLCANCQ